MSTKKLVDKLFEGEQITPGKEYTIDWSNLSTVWDDEDEESPPDLKEINGFITVNGNKIPNLPVDYYDFCGSGGNLVHDVILAPVVDYLGVEDIHNSSEISSLGSIFDDNELFIDPRYETGDEIKFITVKPCKGNPVNGEFVQDDNGTDNGFCLVKLGSSTELKPKSNPSTDPLKGWTRTVAKNGDINYAEDGVDD